MFPSKIEEDYISTDEYMSNKSTAAKRLSPPVISATDHSQRIGKLLPYISSMVSVLFFQWKITVL